MHATIVSVFHDFLSSLLAHWAAAAPWGCSATPAMTQHRCYHDTISVIIDEALRIEIAIVTTTLQDKSNVETLD